jgi:hypothetical protein
MTTDLETMLTRLTDMQKAVVANSDAVEVAFYAQEGTPYWTNRVMSVIVTFEGETIQNETYSIAMQLVLTNVTEGYETQAEKMIQAQLPVILQYFGKRRQLKRTNADAALLGLRPQGAIIKQARVNYNLVNSGTGQKMFGIDILLEVPMYQAVDQTVY